MIALLIFMLLFLPGLIFGTIILGYVGYCIYLRITNPEKLKELNVKMKNYNKR